MTNSTWWKFAQLLSNILDFGVGVSDNLEGINKTLERWSDIVYARSLLLDLLFQ